MKFNLEHVSGSYVATGQRGSWIIQKEGRELALWLVRGDDPPEHPPRRFGQYQVFDDAVADAKRFDARGN